MAYVTKKKSEGLQGQVSQANSQDIPENKGLTLPTSHAIGDTQLNTNDYNVAKGALGFSGQGGTLTQQAVDVVKYQKQREAQIAAQATIDAQNTLSQMKNQQAENAVNQQQPSTEGTQTYNINPNKQGALASQQTQEPQQPTLTQQGAAAIGANLPSVIQAGVQGAGLGALAGAGIGAAGGSVIPAAGTLAGGGIGATVGAVIGFSAGSISKALEIWKVQAHDDTAITLQDFNSRKGNFGRIINQRNAHILSASQAQDMWDNEIESLNLQEKKVQEENIGAFSSYIHGGQRTLTKISAFRKTTLPILQQQFNAAQMKPSLDAPVVNSGDIQDLLNQQ